MVRCSQNHTRTTCEILNLSNRTKSASSMSDDLTTPASAKSTCMLISFARACALKIPQQSCTNAITLTSFLCTSMMPAWIFSNVNKSFSMSTLMVRGV